MIKKYDLSPLRTTIDFHVEGNISTEKTIF